MICYDFDGTIVDYGDHTYPPSIAYPLFAHHDKTQPIAIVTNQGGLPCGMLGMIRDDGRPYPAPRQFTDRVLYTVDALSKRGVHVAEIHCCVYNSKIAHDCLSQCAGIVYTELHTLEATMDRIEVHYVELCRKPSPSMLLKARAHIYYGDSDEDDEAARRAGVDFVRVPRFFG